MKQQLNGVKQLSELETEFGRVSNEKAVVTRYLRSQKPKVTIENTRDAHADKDNDVDDEDSELSSHGDIDPYELLDPVDILSKLPKDFYDKLESKKWLERKEALEALDLLLKNPKLENGDYGEMIRALKKVRSVVSFLVFPFTITNKSF